MVTGPSGGGLVGRDPELAEVVRLVRAAGAGAGGFALIEGEAGIGKSALLDVVATVATTEHGAVVLRGRAWEEGGAPPFWPWREVASAGGWTIDWDGHRDPFSLYQEVAGAARQAARSTTGPVVILLDDMHAADDDTRRLTRFVARTITSDAVVVVAATRPGAAVDLDRLGMLVALRPLGAGEVDALIEARAGAAIEPSVRNAIRERAEGNPLFATVLARSATSGRPVSSGILGVVAPAMAAQSPETRALVELAAVLGRAFRPDRLAAVTGRSVAEVLDALEPLRRAGVVTVAGHPPVGLFSHQLVRDVLYDDLPPARRLELHAAVAVVIAAEQGPDAVAERAHHLLAAVPFVDAATACAVAVDAAVEARARLAHADAAALVRRALELTTDPASRVEMLLAAGVDLRIAGRVGEASAAFDEALTLARPAGERVVDVVLARTELVGTGTAAIELIPIVDDALGRLAPADTVGHVRLLARRALLRSTGTDLDGALLQPEYALALARGLDREALGDALAAVHRCCWGPDHLEESLLVSEELVDVTTRLGDVDRLSEALLARLIDHLRAGNVLAADDALATYAAFAARTGRPRHRYFLDSRRAMRAFMAGRLAEGELLNDRAFELGRRIEEPDAVSVFHGTRMLVVADLQSADETLESARMADELTRRGETLHPHAALSYERAGALDDARALLHRLRASVPALTLAHLSLFELCMVAQTAVACGDREIAEQLWATLLPHAGRAVVNAGAVTFGGVVDEYLAGLAGLLSRPWRDEMLRTAIARYDEMGTAWLAARARQALEAAQPSAPSATVQVERVVVLRPAGDHWELVVEGRRTVLRDARGLHHLRALLRAPGQEIAAIDLVGTQARELSREAHHALLDERAKAAYRKRVRDLQAELDRADAAADVERSEHARAELDLLLDELRRAVGLGGRDRPSGTIAERARVTVRKAVTASLDHIAEHEPALAQQLHAWIQTGSWCAYHPDPVHPVTWDVGWEVVAH